MDLLERFSTHLRDALAKSIQLATDLKNPLVEPAHLFFTLFNQRGSLAAEIIARSKLNLKSVEQAILSLPVINEPRPSPGAGAAVAQAVLSPLSAGTRQALERAMVIAHSHKHAYIGTEHALLAIVELGDPLVTATLKGNGVEIAEIKKQLASVLGNTAQFPELSEVSEMVERLEEHLEALGHQHEGHSPAPAEAKKTKKKETALDWFATHLTSPSAQKRIDPVIGREKEIERVIQILCRRTKNNPLLLGDPGVGKTAIVEGLAKKILAGEVPEPILNKKIYALDMGLLIAGTMYRGEFEGRLRQVIEEVLQNPNIVLFIDEIHTIVGAGNSQGAMDAANLLKPALARGELRCIGATTAAEYKKHLESDAALERRFQPVYVGEPSVEDTIRILEGIKENYEAYHQVGITAEALSAAARLADRYIPNKFLPDKAIDVLDETAAAKRLEAKRSPLASRLVRLENQLAEAVAAKETAAAADRFTEAVELKKTEERLRQALQAALAEQKKKKTKRLGTVGAADVVAQVAKMVGAAPAELLISDDLPLQSLESALGQRVVGQTPVIHTVAALIRQAQLGLSHPERPLASFLFVGESGVGKTELAKTLSEALYHDKAALIKLDMSEFNEAFGVSKLLGSPAGYIGYKESNQFTDKIKLHPYCVILFDEIDKAHKEVLKLLLQMLEEGTITDSTGKTISLRHAIIVLTTSYGADQLKKGTLGFGRAPGGSAAAEGQLIEKLKECFTPELINRLDRVCLFQPLGPAELVQIAELELRRLNEQLAAYHTAVRSNHDVLQWVVKNLEKQAVSARDLRRVLRGELEELFAKQILARRIKDGYDLAVEKEHLAIR